MRKCLIIACLLLTACADVPDDETIDCIVDAGQDWEGCFRTPTPSPTVLPQTPTPVPTVGKTPTAEKTVTPAPTNVPDLGGNPVCKGVQDSRQHLLWKPVSDNRPSSVIVFDSKYQKLFNKVEVELKTGKFALSTNGNLEVWGNPQNGKDRQHHRFLNPEVRCGQVKDKAIIKADDGYQVCTFQLPGDACKRWE